MFSCQPSRLVLSVAATLFLPALVTAEFTDDFSSKNPAWGALDGESAWNIEEGRLRAHTSGGDHNCLLTEPIATDAVVQTRVSFHGEGRRNFGIVLRAQDDGRFLMLRYYDSQDALQLLTHTPSGFSEDRPLSQRVRLFPSKDYFLKVAVVGDRLAAKMWPEETQEPDWQFHQKVSLTEAGRFGLGVHDSGHIGFDDFSLVTEDEYITTVRETIAREQREQRDLILNHLALQVEVAPLACPHEGTRRMDVVMVARGQRVVFDGTFHVHDGDRHERHEISAKTHPTGMLILKLPESRIARPIRIVFDAGEDVQRETTVTLEPASSPEWTRYVRTCLDTLLEHGTDRYGSVETDMLMSIVDVYTLNSPERPQRLDAEIRTEGRPTHGRLSPAGSNLWLDMPVIKALYLMSERSGDTRYARAADAYIADTFTHATKNNGLLSWGSHSYYNAYTDKPDGDVGSGQPVHEILIKHADWEAMHRVNPKAFRRFVDGLWKWHVVDKKTGLHNRHDDGRPGCDFAFSGGSFAMAFAALSKLTNDESYLDKARLVAAWHYENRNPETGLTADCPNLKRRYDGNHCFTTVSGPHAAALLRCYEWTGEDYFRDAAMTYIQAYDRYAWDENAQSYCGMVTLDGECIPEQKKGAGYDIWKPTGHVDVWRTTMYSYEMPLIAAQTSVYAYHHATTDAERQVLLRSARRWAQVIRNQMPPRPGRRWDKELHAALPQLKTTGGTYAENYGRAISFFVGLHEINGDPEDLKMAETLARDAVQQLFVNGLFRGHPAKPYYQSNEGVGYVLLALMQLDDRSKELALAF